MAFQGMLQEFDGHGVKVVFQFGGQVHEVHLPAASYPTQADAAGHFVREEAATVLQCLTARAALELQRALAATGGGPVIESPPFVSELHGSFADLVQQLQECVNLRRAEQWDHLASTDLLLAAVDLRHLAAVQQLLLFDPRAGSQPGYDAIPPVHRAALDPQGMPVLKLLLAAAPELLHATCEYDEYLEWTLMHSAAHSGCVDAVRLLLQLAPQQAAARTDFGHTPLHEAAGCGSLEVVQLLLQAAPETAAVADNKDFLPLHWAASDGHTAVLRMLIDWGAPGINSATDDGTLPLHMAARHGSVTAISLLVAAYPAAARVTNNRGRLPLHNIAEGHGSTEAVNLLLAANPAAAFVQDSDGRLPLHWAARGSSEAVVRLLLAANPAAALTKDSEGRLPLQRALHHPHWPHGRINYVAARPLLPASGLSAAQLLDLLATVPAQPLVQPLYADLAAHMALTPEQWQRVPTPCHGLGRALPAVLARSEAEATLLLAHLPPRAAERLRIALLSLHRVQRSLQLSVPAALVGRVLELALADD